eukprot:Nitzschia sp. Nitz4//scaffold341_size29662//21574//22003//NITZ4_008041-RA/size29662-augustus-gene-0.10-mRNA-1//-1//CDS//3329548555//2689//frame0
MNAMTFLNSLWRTSIPAAPLATNFQQRFMSKYLSKSAAKRVPLNTKRAGKGYYKGKGGTKEGKLNSKGRFIVDPKKRLELIVPDLEGCQLKPYIASTASKFAPEIRRRPGQTL